MTNANCWLSMGALLAGLAVVTGAFAAHGLDGYLAKKYAEAEPRKVAGVDVPMPVKRLQDFHTAATYQMYHALGLIAVGLLLRNGPSTILQLAGWSFLAGIVLFSGSLYVLVLSGKAWWGAITPFGGLLFIVGWVAMAVGAYSSKIATS